MNRPVTIELRPGDVLTIHGTTITEHQTAVRPPGGDQEAAGAQRKHVSKSSMTPAPRRDS